MEEHTLYRVKDIIKYNDRDYAVLFTISGVPYLEHKRDKNHEEHAYNSFVKDKKQFSGLEIVVDDRNHYRETRREKVKVFLRIENEEGIRTYEGSF